MKDVLRERIRTWQAVVAVVGLGHVGLPLALRFSECGFRVIDTDAEREGARVAFSDPHVPELRWAVHKDVSKTGVSLSRDLLAMQDLALLATDHDAFDYDAILKNKLIVDTRGRYLEPSPNVVKA